MGVAAYYVSDREIPVDQLREHLADRLPAPVVPQFYKHLTDIPLSASGKADLAALPAVTNELVQAGRVDPEGPVQERIADIWSEILHLEEVDASKSFFELGGTSLAAMEVMLRLCREFDLDLPLQTAFQHPSISGLAEVIEAQILAELDDLSEAEAEQLIQQSESEP